ncbi:discoidin domain-containing protein [Coraliomargarita akajimensis]|uniref:Coagulation factor 5/8 type domain protein n=1 Tax=Coraliomargarita akajimensis (strain DSM 45221 / IAM 15411 / JCM 23193 / KCTC 12865 / 04OKA010-24) TaxID=583355 RepID=D5ENY2_CORAD|nr:discoidin domain-containing protein [Coraliomargarita akajimensis]ADE53641.1 coagulation factor 5/8 type domain protein [Coraliomargarita akajimensis DSM 45221]
MTESNHHFEKLVWKQLDQEITEQEFDELQGMLKDSKERRSQYQHLVEVHQGLQHRAAVGETSAEFSQLQPLSQIPSAIRSKLRQWRWATGVTAALCLLAFIYAVVQSMPNNLAVTYVALRDADIRGENVEIGDRASQRIMHLMSGAVALRFPGKTEAVIEGPAWFQVQDNETVVFSSGTITVHHEGKPGAFKLVTPVGDLIDMGTKFGVTIGNGVTGSMVMTEVYEGEVIYSNRQNTQLSITGGKGIAIKGNQNSQDIINEIQGEEIKVAGTFELPTGSSTLKRSDNLALGKPVEADSYYNQPESGEVFPPSALTDNRGADTGSPWDWSFWLAGNSDSGSVTVDLLEVYEISRVELQNTRNRHHNDRGINDFILEVSADGENFTQVVEASLPNVSAQTNEAYAFHSFEFPSTKARFVRLTGKSHHNYSTRNNTTSGGLNEIRIFE